MQDSYSSKYDVSINSMLCSSENLGVVYDIKDNGITKDIKYIFYENHTIKRVYDNHSLNFNKSEWLDPKEISKQNKDKLIKSCPEEFKEQIMQILDYP